MQFNNQPQQKPAPSFGSAQDNFTFNFRRFQVNDQFTIIEDLPRNKPVRTAFKKSLNPKPGKSDTYQVCLIRINCNSFEADLEIYPDDLTDRLAVACPKDIPNFKGVTVAFDGRKWVYICQDTQSAPISQPQQPHDQKELFIRQLIEGMRFSSKMGMPMDKATVEKIAENITLGNGKQLVEAAKQQGYITESAGIFVARD